MQRSAKRTAAVAAATLALFMSGIGVAFSDTTGTSNGSAGSGNNVDIDLGNNVTVCDLAGAGLIGLAHTSECAVWNSFDGMDGDDTTGDSDGSILSANNVDLDALTNVVVCDIAVAIGIALASTSPCVVHNSYHK